MLRSKSTASVMPVMGVVALLGLAGSARATDAACKPVVDALAKLARTPFHLYTTETADTDARLRGGQPRSSEEISTVDALYVYARGQWRRSPMSLKEATAEKDETLKAMSCRHVRDELVEGDMAALYAIHEQIDESTTSDSQTWISIAKGLPLKQEQALDVGGTFGKSQRVTRFDYAKVAPPPGVK